jgi:hypothetical protein
MMRPVLGVAVLLSALPASAQEPVGQLEANERFVYVLRGDVLFQFDATTLALMRQTVVPTGAPQPAARAEPAEQLTEVVEEIEEPPRAGGKFGGRSTGRKALVEGGAQRTARAIELGLEWLKRHQDDDGKWDADGFMKHDAGGAPTDGAGNPSHDVGVTGLALLAFLGDGNTMRSGPYRDVVKNAVRWLREQQDPSTGLFGTRASNEFVYDHAIATLAIVEAYGLSDYRLLRPTAQAAIDYLERHRNPYSVWRYQPRDGDNDMSVTGWCLMAYRSAQDFELDVNGQALKLAEAWIDEMTDPVSGRTGYAARGSVSSRRAGDHARRFPHDSGECMTAVALFSRFLLGQSPDRQSIMVPQADLILKKPPAWQKDPGRIDHDYWYHGTNAMYQMGGRWWDRWQKSLDDALVAPQRDDGNFRGSWDPAGVWGEDGGRVYSTALSCLTLEAYYRYARMVR